jgi:hypothetical protein
MLSLDSRLRGNDVLLFSSAIHANGTQLPCCLIYTGDAAISRRAYFHAAHFVSALVVYAWSPGIVVTIL